MHWRTLKILEVMPKNIENAWSCNQNFEFKSLNMNKQIFEALVVRPVNTKQHKRKLSNIFSNYLIFPFDIKN